jgi:hypothetical protein
VGTQTPLTCSMLHCRPLSSASGPTPVRWSSLALSPRKSAPCLVSSCAAHTHRTHAPHTRLSDH